MANVIINSSKLDSLAEHIADKAEVSLPLTIAGMETVVDELELENDFIVTINYTVDPEWTQNYVYFIPDCTYAELESAYFSGKNIIFRIGDKTGPYTKSTAYVKGIIDDKSYDNIMIVYFVGGELNNPESYDNRSSNFSIEYDRMEYHWGYSEGQGEGILYSGTASSIIPYGTLNITSNDVGSSGTIIAPSYHAINLPILTLPTTVSLSQGTLNTQIAAITPSTSNQYINISTGFNRIRSSYRIAPIPSQYIIPTGTKSITANGTSIDVAQYATVDVAVPSLTFSLQSKTATPTESAQIIIADNGYNGLSSVSIDAISSTYVGSGINQRSSTDLTASGATVTVPAGYYSAQASKAVTSGSAGTPTATKSTVSNHTVAVVPSVTNTTGYITGGTKTGTAVSVSASELVSGTYTVDSSGTKDVTNYASASVAAGSATAPATISGTSATVSTGTNTLTFSKTISVTPSVTAGYISSGTAGNSSVSLTASVTTKAAATITPSTSNQTISSGTYLTGTQTISGDSNLVGSSIVYGKSIFGVAGTVRVPVVSQDVSTKVLSIS